MLPEINFFFILVSKLKFAGSHSTALLKLGCVNVVGLVWARSCAIPFSKEQWILKVNLPSRRLEKTRKEGSAVMELVH
jgi:hypothetical protein